MFGVSDFMPERIVVVVDDIDVYSNGDDRAHVT